MIPPQICGANYSIPSPCDSKGSVLVQAWRMKHTLEQRPQLQRSILDG